MAFPVTFSMPSIRWAFLPTTLYVEDELMNQSWRAPGTGGGLLPDFRAVFFGEIEITERTVEIHSGPDHMRIHDEDLFTSWTSDFYGLTRSEEHTSELQSR